MYRSMFLLPRLLVKPKCNPGVFFLQRIVEILDPSPFQDGLIEEPYVSKKKKTKKVRRYEIIFHENLKSFFALVKKNGWI